MGSAYYSTTLRVIVIHLSASDSEKEQISGQDFHYIYVFNTDELQRHPPHISPNGRMI